MITIYTCIIDGFDNLRPPLVPVTEGVRYICFTNVPHLPRVDPWEFRPAHMVCDPFSMRVNASKTSRLPKILPHLFLPEETTYSIWHDGNFQLTMDPERIVAEALHAGIEDADWAAHSHPARDCVYDEAEVLRSQRIGDRPALDVEMEMIEQIHKHPRHAGLWANGFIVRRHCQPVIEACENWWKMFQYGGGRDQISFPIAARGLRLNTLRPRSVYDSPYVKFSFHAPWKHRDDNPAFDEQRAAIARRAEALMEAAGPGGYEFRVY